MFDRTDQRQPAPWAPPFKEAKEEVFYRWLIAALMHSGSYTLRGADHGHHFR